MVSLMMKLSEKLWATLGGGVDDADSWVRGIKGEIPKTPISKHVPSNCIAPQGIVPHQSHVRI